MTQVRSRSNNVRIHAVRKRTGTRGTGYVVRWRVDAKDWQQTFATAKLAEGQHSALVAASRAGEWFDVRSGLPPSMEKHVVGVSWMDHVVDFMTMKWSEAAPKYRKSLAESLTKVTTNLAPVRAGRPTDAELRSALFRWILNVPARTHPPPDELISAVAWLQNNSRPLIDLADPLVLRELLNELAVNLDGSRAASSTSTRRRSALFNALEYAVELEHLSSNPLEKVKRKRQPPPAAIDRRRVVNASQARALLSATRELAPELEAFFATMYFAGPRPGEVLNLRHSDLTLPSAGWGRVLLTSSYQRAGSAWTDTGKAGEVRGLKHRAADDTREVPLHPQLVEALRAHIERYEIAPTGRLFAARNGVRGARLSPTDDKPVSMKTIYRAWGKARDHAMSEPERESPLARRPYDLRHACLSTWLNAGVAPVQVAEWAGHSVAVLLSVYAKCIDGQEAVALQRIEDAIGTSSEPPGS